MEKVQILTLIISFLTLTVSLIAAVLNYRLQEQKKRVSYLEKNYGIALDNLSAYYEIESYFAGKCRLTRSRMQRELRIWMKKNKIQLNRKYACPSFIKGEIINLKK